MGRELGDLITQPVQLGDALGRRDESWPVGGLHGGLPFHRPYTRVLAPPRSAHGQAMLDRAMIFAVVARRSASGSPQGPQGRHPAGAVDGAEAPRAKLSSDKCDP